MQVRCVDAAREAARLAARGDDGSASGAAHGIAPDTPNQQDSIYRNGGNKGLLALKKSAGGYAAAITMGVHA